MLLKIDLLTKNYKTFNEANVEGLMFLISRDYIFKKYLNYIF